MERKFSPQRQNNNKNAANLPHKTGSRSGGSTQFYLQDRRPKSIVQKKQADRVTSNHVQPTNSLGNADRSGLPAQLKAGIENLSGYSMDDVKVHYNSDKPAQLKALAYAQGTEIHLATGQEKHLPHEAWHVAQQKQGRVKPTLQMKGGVNVNDDTGLEGEADKMSKVLQTKNFVPAGLLRDAGSMPGHSTIQRVIKIGEERQDIPEALKKPITWEGIEEELKREVLGWAEKVLKAATSDTLTVEPDDSALDDLVQETDTDLFVLKQVRKAIRRYKPEIDVSPLSHVINTQHRLKKWQDRITKPDGGRTGKKSTAESKRSKLWQAIYLSRHKGVGQEPEPDAVEETKNTFPFLMHTHTAPPIMKGHNPYRQGKDVVPRTAAAYNYFRTGDNTQSQYFLDNKKKQYIFIPEPLAHYKELYPDSVTYSETSTDMGSGSVIVGTKTDGRPVFSNLGAEVNAQSKLAIIKEKGSLQINHLDLPKGIAQAPIDYEPVGNLADHNKKELNATPLNQETDHMTEILKHCREVVIEIKNHVTLKDYRLVLREENSGYFLYPSLIIEPISTKKKITKDVITDKMNRIMTLFNTDSKIKMFERNSFGFLYPTISDLERSIRIWPGQVDAAYFRDRMITVLNKFDPAPYVPLEAEPQALTQPEQLPEFMNLSEDEAPQDELAPSNKKKRALDQKITPPTKKAAHQKYDHVTLFSTLNRALTFVKEVYNKGGFKDTVTAKWLHQRIANNIAKAKRIQVIKGLFKDPQDLFLELTQIIENLNEYAFDLVELQEWEPTQEEFTQIITKTYGKHITSEGFSVASSLLTHSGTQAANIAIQLTKQNLKHHAGPHYFEFDPFDKASADKVTDKTFYHYDPAYNFVAQSDVEEQKTEPKQNLAKDIHDTVIIDITNISPSEITSQLQKYSSAKMVYLYGSLSKHFQLGMDKFTLGILLSVKKNGVVGNPVLPKIYMPKELIRYFILMQTAQLPALKVEVLDG